MGVLEAVRMGRKAAEKLMTSTVEVRRYTGDIAVDPVTAKASRDYHLVYFGKAKIQTYEAQESRPDVAGNTVTSSRLMVHFPVGSFTAHPGDEVHVIEDTSDPALAGKTLRLGPAAPYKSHATAYRVGADEVRDDG